LLSHLRSREIDFFVTEVSTLQREADPDIEALDEHPLYFVARPGHPLAGRAEITAKETLAFPFVTMSRISPCILQPMMAAQRSATRRSTQAPPFPAIESASRSAASRMVIAPDIIAAVTLPCIREDLECGRIVVLGSEPWLKLAYGIVAL
jgi:DNA-binding transcriptional LysR family regulator